MNVLRTLIAMAVGLALMWIVLRGSPVRMGAVGDADDRALFFAVGAALTLVGVFAGAAYREAQLRRGRGESHVSSYTDFLGGVVRSYDFLLGVIGAPLVYALLLQSMVGISFVGMCVIALQNGYASSTLIGSTVQRAPPGGGALPDGGASGSPAEPVGSP